DRIRKWPPPSHGFLRHSTISFANAPIARGREIVARNRQTDLVLDHCLHCPRHVCHLVAKQSPTETGSVGAARPPRTNIAQPGSTPAGTSVSPPNESRTRSRSTEVRL